MSVFFINRPIFAWVLAIIMMIAGAIAISTLPIAQYPSIAPPAITISVTYPGASAETVQSTVVQVIEQQLSGIDHLLYFSSESDKDGSVSITLSFEQGTDPDIAQVQVQNKLQLAQPRLPAVVQEQGIQVAKSTKNFLLVLGFVSTDGRMQSATWPISSPPRCRMRSAVPGEWVTTSYSAPNTRCGSGSIRRS